MIGEIYGEYAMFYHGTSSKYLDRIQEEGLTVSQNNQNQIYHNHQISDFDIHTDMSMEGIYVTKDPDVAKSYAEYAGKQTGDEPVILELDLSGHHLIIDEDAIGIRSDLKEFLLESWMSTDNDGWFQLKNMILDEDTRDEVLDKLQEWISLGYNLDEKAIGKDDIEKITISFINRMAAHCCSSPDALRFLTEQSKHDIRELFADDVQYMPMVNKYETQFIKDYDEYIRKYSDVILLKRPRCKNFRTIQDITPDRIQTYEMDTGLKM